MRSRKSLLSHRALLGAVPLMAIVGLAAAACSSSEDATATQAPAAQPTSTRAPTQPPATPVPQSSAIPTAAPSGTLIKASGSSLGEVLTDTAGRTLYIFDGDTPGATGCTGGCLTNWPPLLTTGTPGGLGLNAALGVFNRDGSGAQVTVNGMPLYYFSGDTAQGDVKGQGAGSRWWVVDRNGRPVGKPGVAVSPSPVPQSTPTAIPPTPTTPAGAAPATSDLIIANFTHPNALVKAGTTVRWTNRDDAPHTVTPGAPDQPVTGWGSSSLQRGDTYSRVFDTPGAFDYFCEIHPSMRARIIVQADQPAAAATATPTPSTPPQPTAIPTATPTPIPPPTAPQGELVRSTIQDFQLKNLSVKAGTTVEWFNADADPHTATHGSPGAVGAMFRSPLLSQGGTYRHTFTVPGKFPYFCEIHTDMKAEVEVLP